jgi:hypothetical protein
VEHGVFHEVESFKTQLVISVITRRLAWSFPYFVAQGMLSDRELDSFGS